jgi:hypothetical protein
MMYTKSAQFADTLLHPLFPTKKLIPEKEQCGPFGHRRYKVWYWAASSAVIATIYVTCCPP